MKRKDGLPGFGTAPPVLATLGLGVITGLWRSPQPMARELSRPVAAGLLTVCSGANADGGFQDARGEIGNVRE
jgi:hypothetical protein